MALLAFGSVKASPGATTTALAVATCWPGEAVLVEADESGGVMAARLGLGEAPGALQLAGASRSGLDVGVLRRHCQPIGDGVAVLVAPTEPQQVTATFREVAGLLAGVLSTGPVTGIVDAGRISMFAAGWPLVEASALTLLVARCRLEEFMPLAARARDLRTAGVRVAVVLVEEGPYAPEEFADRAGVELAGVLPSDEHAAGLVGASGSTRRLGRSRWWAAIGELTERLARSIVAPIVTVNGNGSSTAATRGTV